MIDAHRFLRVRGVSGSGAARRDAMRDPKPRDYYALIGLKRSGGEVLVVRKVQDAGLRRGREFGM